MSVNWTNELELILIESYHAEPIIWDAKHKDHKNKMKVHDAWMRLKEIINIEVTELKKKKDNLMSSYRSYRKKVKDSESKSGASTDDIYKPIWFAYDAIDAFMGDSDTCKKTINTEEDLAVENEKEEGDQEDRIQSPKLDQRKLTPTIRRRRNPPELQDAGKVVQDALATLKSSMNRKESQSDDMYELYGKMLAKKIKTLPENDRLPFMYEIDGIFLRHQQNSRQRINNRFNSPTQSTSTVCGQPTTSRTIYSHHQSPPPSALYGRCSTCHSIDSEHAINNSPSPVKHNSNDNVSTGSRFIETPIIVKPPVIHIPGYSAHNNSRVIITSNKQFKPAAIRIPNYRTNVNSGGTLSLEEELPVIHMPGYSRNTNSGAIMVSSKDEESPTINDQANSGYEVTESENTIQKAFNFA